MHALIGSDMCSLRASFPGYSGGGTGKELPGELASRLECVGIAELVVTDKNGTFPKRCLNDSNYSLLIVSGAKPYGIVMSMHILDYCAVFWDSLGTGYKTYIGQVN